MAYCMIKSHLCILGEPRMGKLIHTTVHETEHQVTFQVVFQKPVNLAQSSYYKDETNEYYVTQSGRTSPFSNTLDSDS